MNKPLLFTLATSIIWSFSLVNSRYLLVQGENPLNLTVWFLLLSCPLWMLTFKKHRREYFLLSRRIKVLLIFVGVAGSLGINALQSLALANSTAVNFSFLYRTIVIFTIVFAAVFLQEKITKGKLILTVFILLGSFFLTTNGQIII